jgi:hypothetical protein
MSRSALYSISHNHPIPTEVWTPRGVRAAAARARDLYAQHQAEVVTGRSLRDRAQEASHADRIAYRRAAAEGEPMPEPTEPAIREEIAEAGRREEAVEGALRIALVEQAQAVAACHQEWTEHVRADLDSRASKILATLGQLSDEFAALEAEAGTAQTLDRFDGQPRSLQVNSLDMTREHRMREKAARAEACRSRRSLAESTRHALIAALHRLAAEHLRPDPEAVATVTGVTEGAAAGYPEGLTVRHPAV